MVARIRHSLWFRVSQADRTSCPHTYSPAYLLALTARTCGRLPPALTLRHRGNGRSSSVEGWPNPSGRSALARAGAVAPRPVRDLGLEISRTEPGCQPFHQADWRSAAVVPRGNPVGGVV